ncbi:bifunctional sugar-1-phosphate nucleotidylyltransferase/acetyltransferase [Dehalogenimonas sp. THU2]|uniref:bifunctional sugar-1-phosphate nucleotidylyltransferase/acetyltransferase n=1 Tax=Dehalogenimonas sp. THU2 TaxID=3151121 RepID=UPI0032189E93
MSSIKKGSRSTQIVIMAAGEGSRMRPLTETRPKVMLPVVGKPMLEHLVEGCREAGYSDLIIITGYYGEKVREYFGDGGALGVRIRYVSQRRAQGTADALKQAVPLLDGPFMLLNGDIMLRAGDISLLGASQATTLSLTQPASVEGMGVVELEGERVVRLHEKSANPPTCLANAGAYYFTTDIFAALERTTRSPRGEFEITDTIQLLIDGGVPVLHRFLTSWRDIGYPWELLAANEELSAKTTSQIDGVVEPGVVIKGAIAIGEGSTVRSGSYITGPAVIGKHCDIGPNCYIRPFTSIGDHCHIGAGVEIKNSIIMAGTKVPHLSYVGDSVIGENCNLGAGTQVANLRFDRRNVQILGRDSGRHKLGVIMGDGVSTGVNACINPGTVIGSYALIGPGAVVSGRVAAGARVF